MSSNSFPRRITALSGGVGGARFLQGLLHLIRRRGLQPWVGDGVAQAPADAVEVTVIANTADDIRLHGLLVSPDLDTVMYTLGDGIDTERGWGRREETWHAKEELAAYGAGPEWFGLGDRDLATHVLRSDLLARGHTLSEATRRLCDRWQPQVRLLPMSDDRVETHLRIEDPETSEVRLAHLQEYWIRFGAAVDAHAVEIVGLAEASPAPGVLEAIRDADLVMIPPSNPVVSVGPILAVPGVAEALRHTEAPVVGVSGIIGRDHVRGMARQLLGVIGVEVSAAGIAGHYGARNAGGVLDAWLIDQQDADLLDRIGGAGISTAAVPLWMTDVDATADMAEAAIDLAFGRAGAR